MIIAPKNYLILNKNNEHKSSKKNKKNDESSTEKNSDIQLLASVVRAWQQFFNSILNHQLLFLILTLESQAGQTINFQPS